MASIDKLTINKESGTNLKSRAYLSYFIYIYEANHQWSLPLGLIVTKTDHSEWILSYSM